MTESLINALSHIQDLRVPARTSSFAFRGQERNIREIGQKLDVKALLEGSVQKADTRIRITAQLINVKDEALIWSEQYNRELNDVFAIQDDITLAIVDKLKVNLMGGEKAKLIKRYTGNVEAYELYLKGRYFWEKRTGEEMEKAIDNFQKAIQVDPEFALAYAGMADGYATLGWYGFVPREIASQKAIEAAEKALQIDPTLSEAQVSLGNVRINFLWDWQAAKKSFERAIELNPSNAEAHHQYAHLIAQQGHLQDGIAEMRRALELEPLSVVISSCLGQVLYFAHQYDEAIEELEKAIEIDPSYKEPYGTLGMIYLKKGQFEKAIAMLEKGATSSTFKTRMIGALGYAYALQGKKDEAQKMLQELRELAEKQHVDPCFRAWIQVGLGEKEQAFQLLDQAYEERANWMLILKIDPFFDSLRSDPKFKALLEKMKLEEDKLRAKESK